MFHIKTVVRTLKFWTEATDMCQSFQTTFNDHGVCYTFNNVEQPLQNIIRFRNKDDVFKVKAF